MQGRIVRINEEMGFGIIRADDGRRLRFDPLDIVNPEHRLLGRTVEFDLFEGEVIEISLLCTTPWFESRFAA